MDVTLKIILLYISGKMAKSKIIKTVKIDNKTNLVSLLDSKNKYIVIKKKGTYALLANDEKIQTEHNINNIQSNVVGFFPSKYAQHEACTSEIPPKTNEFPYIDTFLSWIFSPVDVNSASNASLNGYGRLPKIEAKYRADPTKDITPVYAINFINRSWSYNFLEDKYAKEGKKIQLRKDSKNPVWT